MTTSKSVLKIFFNHILFFKVDLNYEVGTFYLLKIRNNEKNYNLKLQIKIESILYNFITKKKLKKILTQINFQINPESIKKNFPFFHYSCIIVL